MDFERYKRERLAADAELAAAYKNECVARDPERMALREAQALHESDPRYLAAMNELQAILGNHPFEFCGVVYTWGSCDHWLRDQMVRHHLVYPTSIKPVGPRYFTSRIKAAILYRRMHA